MRHGRQLAADSLQSQKESAVEHAGENATEAPCCYNQFSANGNNPLNFVSQPRGAVKLSPSPNPIPCEPTTQGKSVTYVSGTKCYLCLGPLKWLAILQLGGQQAGPHKRPHGQLLTTRNRALFRLARHSV